MKKIARLIPGIGYFLVKRPFKGIIVLLVFSALVAYSILSTRYVPQTLSLAIALWLAYIIDVSN